LGGKQKGQCNVLDAMEQADDDENDEDEGEEYEKWSKMSTKYFYCRSVSGDREVGKRLQVASVSTIGVGYLSSRELVTCKTPAIRRLKVV
jgi:hypothetical protein